MNSVIKRTVAIILAGVFILACSAGLSAEAANGKKRAKREVDPARIAAKMSEVYGVSQIALLKHHAGGMTFRDLQRAANFAGMSGKSLDEVVELKKGDKTWKEVAQSLNITKEQRKAQRQKIVVARIQQRTGVEKQTAQALLQQGHKLRDVAIASTLAKQSGKSINDVIALKTQDSKWRKIGTDLGLDEKQATRAIKQARFLMSTRYHHGHPRQ